MKKQLLLLAATLVITTLAMAQSATSFGVRGGLSSAGIRGDASANLEKLIDFSGGMLTTGNRTGFFAGAYASLPLSSVMSVEPAVYYSQKGYALKGNLLVKAIDFLGAGGNASLNLQYIDVPVLVKATINGFQVFAGPQVSYLANANLHTSAGILGINLLNNKTDVAKQFNRWDAGVTGGVGYQFTNGVSVTAAYDQGLMKMDANQSLASYNRAFKVGLGYRF